MRTLCILLNKLLCDLSKLIPMVMMAIVQHYNTVCFDRAIQHWILSLPIYIMNPCTYGTRCTHELCLLDL